MNLTEDPRSVPLSVLKITQPIGSFFLGVVDSKVLCEITYFDVRRMLREREFETYLGIQRPLNPKRVKEIEQFVSTIDACFPTAVILSVPAVCAQYDEASGKLTLSNYVDPEDDSRRIFYRQIAKVLDGQHRIEGLRNLADVRFEVNVCIFIDLDVAQEGYIFSTVNLAQTKVNRSLAYDLFGLARAPSPQKLCHNIAVALDQSESSPFYHRIKRLGTATEGRFNETLTQATFVESLLPYMSLNPVRDRDQYQRDKTPSKAGAEESRILIFRNMMIDGEHKEITDVLWNYFEAVRQKWPRAWNSQARGMILNKTNGFRALMRFLRPAYLHIAGPGEVPSASDFSSCFQRLELNDDDFNTDNFKPGAGGELMLYNTLRQQSRI